jgi:hypothetical protein
MSEHSVQWGPAWGGARAASLTTIPDSTKVRSRNADALTPPQDSLDLVEATPGEPQSVWLVVFPFPSLERTNSLTPSPTPPRADRNKQV